MLDLAKYAAQHWNPALKGETDSLARYKFENYVKEIYVDSDTKVALLSGAPFDDPTWWLLSNDQIVRPRDVDQRHRRLATPARPHRVHARSSPAGWTRSTGDRDAQAGSLEGLHHRRSARRRSKFPWRLDDEKLMYPFYEKAVKAGINTICIHKGLLPADYEKSWPASGSTPRSGTSARPPRTGRRSTSSSITSALRPFLETAGRGAGRVRADRPHPVGHRPRRDPGEVRRQQRLCARSAPRSPTPPWPIRASRRRSSARWSRASGPITCSGAPTRVWYGSPQWQIEAMRRLEIPEDMQKKHGFAPLGAADGAVKQTIFGGNAARLYRLKLKAAENAPLPAYSADRLASCAASTSKARPSHRTCATDTCAPAKAGARERFIL